MESPSFPTEWEGSIYGPVSGSVKAGRLSPKRETANPVGQCNQGRPEETMMSTVDGRSGKAAGTPNGAAVDLELEGAR
jgi:hypothetical protein